MKTKIPKLEAYFYNQSTGKQMAVDQRIYLMIKERPMTIEQLRNYQMPHQTISSAITRLERLGLIYKGGTAKGKKGGTAKGKKFTYSIYVASKTIAQCEENIKAIKKRDFERWYKIGSKNGFFYYVEKDDCKDDE
jgi:predicted transcriptional regulator